MSLIDKLTDMLMSRDEDEYIEEEEFEEGEELEEVQETRQVVNGAAVAYAASKAMPAASTHAYSRPKLTVHENKAWELSVQIHTPNCFDAAQKIADALLEHKAALVNYERVEAVEQRRICDFLNGVCYILDGEPRRISEQMVVYVPSNVEVAKAKAKPFQI